MVISSKNMPPKHCMVVHAYYPYNESRVEREALTLLEAGYEVDIICLKNEDELPMETIKDINVYRLPVRRHRGSGPAFQMLEYLSFLILSFFKLLVLSWQQRYRTVQVHNLPDFLVFAALGPKLSGSKIILDLHDLMPEFFATNFNRSMDSLPARLVVWQEQLSCRFADHVITVTDLWRETLIQRGVPEQKVSVVMNVADSKVFHRNGTIKRKTKKGNEFRLIYHGTLTYRYGVDLLLHTVSSIRHQIPGIRLTIHGRGEYLPELLNLYKSLDLEDQVHFSTQYLPVSDLSKFIQNADVGMVPYRRSVFTDGILPTKMMEYVALGVPIIAARTPIIEEYFDDSMVKFFSPGDVEDLTRCILELYQDDDRLFQLAKNADRFNQSYNWATIAAHYVSIVEQLGKT